MHSDDDENVISYPESFDQDDLETSFTSYNPFQESPKSKTSSKRRSRASSPSKRASTASVPSKRHSMPSSSPSSFKSSNSVFGSPSPSVFKAPRPLTPRTSSTRRTSTIDVPRRSSTPQEQQGAQTNLNDIFFYSVKKRRAQTSTLAKFQRAFGGDPDSPSPNKEQKSTGTERTDLSFIGSSKEEETIWMRFRSALLLVGCLLSIIWTILWMWEKQQIGFCDPSSLYNLKMHQREVLTYMPHPGCFPCPPRGLCSGGTIAGCNSSATGDTFVLQPHPLQFGGTLPPLVPFGIIPTCVPDTAALQLVVDIVRDLKGKLKRRKGEVLCAKRAWWGDRDWQKEIGVDFKTLMGWVGEESELTELWPSIKAELKNDPECIVESDWISSVNEELGWICWIRLRTFQWLWKNIVWVAVAIVFGYQLLRLRYIWKVWRTEPDLVRKLYVQTIETVRDNAFYHRLDPVAHPYDYIVPVYLRDSLMDDHPISERKRVWAKVERKVAGNSNVRSTSRTHKGESVLVWEWVGGDSPRKSIGGNASPPGQTL